MVVLLTTASLEGQHLAKSFFNTGLLGAAGSSAPSDDQFNRVSFLSHFEGSNNGVNNAFDDGSSSNHTITANGNVTQGSFGPFARPDGEWGVDFEDGDSLAVASSSDFDFGTSNFTWECFVFQKSRSAFQLIMSQDDYSTGNSISCWLTDTGQASIYYEGGGTHFTTTATVPLNTWTHLAWVRKGTGTNEFSIYINGTAEVSGTMTTSFNQDGIIIGQQANGNYDFIGNISNIRIVNGSAVYTGNFTTPTGKLTAVTNTKLLTCQSNRFVDNSASAHTITPAGSPAVTAFGPFLTSKVYDPAVNGASAYLASGDSDYLQMPAQTIPTGSYTLEGWYYLTGTSTNQSIISQGSSGNSKRTFFGIENGVLTFQMGGTTETGPNPPKNSWNHFACVYNSSYPFIQAWHNGVSTGATGQNNGDAENVAMQIGTLGSNWGSGFGVTGYVSDIRVSSGIKYTANNITVPTSPLAVEDSNTKLLLNMADAQAIDSAAQNNLTLYGNAKISTGQAKFGNTSLYLDGSDDYLVVNNHKAYGTGPFTIEMFFRLDSVSGSRCLYDDRPDGASGDYISLIIASGAVNFYVGTTLKVDAGSISANTFYHIALCRSGTDTKLFLDGTQIGSTFSSDTTNYLNTGILRVGTNRGYNNDLAGYIDEFRISHMARYTSNFTAPTKAFTDKGQ